MNRKKFFILSIIILLIILNILSGMLLYIQHQMYLKEFEIRMNSQLRKYDKYIKMLQQKHYSELNEELKKEHHHYQEVVSMIKDVASQQK